MIKEKLHQDNSLELSQMTFKSNLSKSVNNIEIVEGDVSHLKNVYLKMKEDFVADELKDYDQFKILISKMKYKLLLAKPKGLDEVIGYAFVYVLDNLKAKWLDYIAIDKQYRNCGYGTLFFKKLVESKQNGFLGTFIEVETPSEQGGQNREIKVRRINFYERLGAKKLNINYLLPTNEGGFPMYLYFKPSPDQQLLSKNQIKEAISEAFEYIHSDVKNKDVLLKKIVSTIVDERFVN